MRLDRNIPCHKKFGFLYNVKTETDGTRNDQCFMSLE
jgi:hypothetical protein